MSVGAGSSAATQDHAPQPADVAADTGREERKGSASTERLTFRDLIKQALSTDSNMIWLLAGCFLIIKVLLVTHGDVMSALAVIRSSGVLAVVIGAIISALPLIAAVGLVVILYGCGRGVWGWHTRKDPFKVLLGVLVLIVCFALTPWLVVTLCFLGLILGFGVSTFRKRQSGRHKGEADSRPRIGLLPVLILSIAVLAPVTPDFFLAMWLPREELHFQSAVEVTRGQPQKAFQVGYVLSDSEGWMSLLTSQDRELVEIKSSIVTTRHLCRKNYHEPAFEVILRRLLSSTGGPPDCTPNEANPDT